MTNLTDLEQRLVRAVGADRELDLALLNAVSEHVWTWRDRKPGWETITHEKYGPGAVGNPVCSLEQFTDSIDAAVGLCERVLPGWWWNIECVGGQTKPKQFFTASVWTVRDGKKFDVGTAKPTAPLALCLALVRALQTKDGAER